MKKTLFFLSCIGLLSAGKAQTITDVDGNTYETVTIGTQTWMAENLKVTRYNDGTPIPNVPDDVPAGRRPYYCWYDDDSAAYKSTFGALYSWYAVNTGMLCPSGWHVPSDSEFYALEDYLLANGYNYDSSTVGNKYAKALAADTGWVASAYTGAVGNTDYPARRNSTGFTVVPGGYCDNDGGGYYYTMGMYGMFWTSDDDLSGCAVTFYLTYDSCSVRRMQEVKSDGLSVRCIKGADVPLAIAMPVDGSALFPNPASDKLYYKNGPGSDEYYMIYDINGKLIQNGRLGMNSIDISDLQKGTYIIKLIQPDTMHISKFIKE